MWHSNWSAINDKFYLGRAMQIVHIQDELNEVIDALNDSHEHYLEEMFDLAHAVETLILRETDEAQREYWQQYVSDKNNERGYYG